ncbi:DUF2271 domain-containing protein [Desertibaculum subflavum]|uniref:DUF2271 domain-containing protein n=1 Tax=Desertibaculum subflavum TaxID=2268458 RepID=UPI000E67634A
MRFPVLSFVATGLVAPTVLAAELSVTVEIPRLTVAEYHRPYVAIWLERKGQSGVTNLAVWYDVKVKDGEGTKWLKDMRQWWRRTGRELQMPMDGITGATRAPGAHTLQFAEGTAPLGALPAGNYELVVEAAREVGGRELLRLPLQWPPKAPVSADAQGDHELGRIQLQLKP